MKILKIILIIDIIASVKCKDVIDIQNYDVMPPIHLHDDYWDCMQNYKESMVYCVAKTYIKPNDSSNTWQTIERFSSEKKHFFRHDTVTRGVCVNACRSKLDAFDKQYVEGLYVNKFPIDRAIYHPGIPIHDETERHRSEYNTIINQCINTELQETYHLEGYSEIEYCMTSKTEEFKIDALDWFCLVFISTIILLVLIGTLYDVELRSQTGFNPYHYRKFPYNSNRLLLAFSLPRNWAQLVNHSDDTSSSKNNNNNNANVDDFTFFDTLKVLVMLGNTVVHVHSMMSMIPSINHSELEFKTQSLLYKIFSGATFTNQIYLAIGAFLCTLGPVKQLKQGKVLGLSDFWDALQKRYFRLTPLHAYALLFEATWISKIYNGPIWTQMAGMERASCRKNWWSNLLYVNNIFGYQEPCLLPTWYLATDMQLFILRFVFLAIISRFPKRKVQLFAFVIILSYIIPAWIVYSFELDGLYLGNAEIARYFYKYDSPYRHFHIPFHSSIGSYFFGMLTAFIYREVKDENIDVTKSRLFMFIWKAAAPTLLFCIFGVPYIFLTFEFEKPALWIALYGAFHRNVWGICVGALILGYNANLGGQWKDLFNASAFRPLGKINYGFYLTHLTVTKVLIGNLYHPYHVSIAYVLILVANVTIVSYITGTVAHLFVELPAANLQKEWNSRKPPVENKKIK